MFEELRPHLAELRKRIGLSVLSVFIAFGIAFTFHETILAWITAPLDHALAEVKQNVTKKSMTQWHIDLNASRKITSEIEEISPKDNSGVKAAQNLSKSLTQAAQATEGELKKGLENAAKSAYELAASLRASKIFNPQVTTHQVAGTFFVALKVSFFVGLLLAMPFILYQLWLFVAPGLYSHEKKMVFPFVAGGSVMFLSGVLFAYYIVTPFGFQFLITFGSFLYTPLINIEDYVGFFTKIMMGFGIAFELPVFAYFLALLGLVTDRTLKDFFKYAVVIIFVLAALLTPPDILTQLLMAAPLVILYGISILIVAVVNPDKNEDGEDGEKETEKM
ncbi:MAG: twin-arginine translocase subunit TatC [Sulfurovum sp.]|nr:twin-arginine translocase subunit TatC [Sulfurovum sp.]MCB4752313.1 twin-arginine translocase subunit TatC [Sulfurovum sp.]MCB4753566.1 twin-arginine translocase subunit TatC [Sulfurovum sp.]MCB4759010.1 twin-arginine translocase subunit TatC [Sulfurovum sp.]MCB4763710.1 twin-arginine translocase subunit TatC [Sulfurovum sp.]